jgi:hypothetical protein
MIASQIANDQIGVNCQHGGASLQRRSRYRCRTQGQRAHGTLSPRSVYLSIRPTQLKGKRIVMKAVNPYLNFAGNTEQAFEFYRTVFGGEL